MSKLEKVRTDIRRLYQESSDEFMRTWFFDNHVGIVAKYGKEITSTIGADPEIVVLSALFHDVARTWGIAEEPDLMKESLKKVEEIMKKHGYDAKQIKHVKDTIVPHSCREILPKTKEGKALATADALAHLMTDFYLILFFNGWLKKDFEGYRKWGLEKIERDFNKKIFFSYYKKLAKKRYEALKVVFTKI